MKKPDESDVPQTPLMYACDVKTYRSGPVRWTRNQRFPAQVESAQALPISQVLSGVRMNVE